MADDAPDSSFTQDLGPLVLLKRLGNAVEANLAKNKLATADIPAFLAGENTFAGDVMHPLPYREVELWVPQSLAEQALEVLNARPIDEDEIPVEPFCENPSDLFSSRAFVAAIVGWLFFTLATFGVVCSLPVFVYSIYLAIRFSISREDRSRFDLLKCICSTALSALGIAAVAAFLFFR